MRVRVPSRSVPVAAAAVLLVGAGMFSACRTGPFSRPSASEAGNPLRPLPEPPLGVDGTFADLADPPTPERVRLGRWLFFDPRLSSDGSVSCATCHRPEVAFAESRRVSVGVGGRLGTRKSQPIANLAWTLYPHFFWDGRAASLEEQALGPITNPIEMGLSHEQLVAVVQRVPGYRPYFGEAFGDDRVTRERIVKAIADYERTILAGNSAWDRWRRNRDASAVSDEVKRGHELFFGKASCNQCHLGQNLTDDRFHNIGIGWNAATRSFADEGRYLVTKRDEDRGAFKTPTLRDVSRRAPYMHDGSMATLREVVEDYNVGGTKNPWLSPKVFPLGLTEAEVDALVAFMKALDSELPPEPVPTTFPQ